MQNEHLNSQDSPPVAGATAPPNAQEAGKTSTAVRLLRHSLDTFLAKDIKGWAELCDVNVVVEFPFAPDEASRRMVGRTAMST
jgi:hypothetical protein